MKRKIALLVVVLTMLFTTTVSAAAISDRATLAEAVSTAMQNRETTISIEYDGNYEDIEYVFGTETAYPFFYYDLLIVDDPTDSTDSDYLLGICDPTTIELAYDNDVLTIGLGYFETVSETEESVAYARDIVEELNLNSLSRYDAVKAVYEYVCDLITYEDDESYSSPYLAYTQGKGLCNSYALCMYQILSEAGIPAKYIGGKAGTGRDSDGHAWNLVQMEDGFYYYLDATWDDTAEDGTYCYDYFLKGSSDFDEADPTQEHTLDEEYNITAYFDEVVVSTVKYGENTDVIDTNTANNAQDSELSNSNYEDDYEDDGFDGIIVAVVIIIAVVVLIFILRKTRKRKKR